MARVGLNRLSWAASSGHAGVDLFFILSGFILAYNYRDSFQQFSFRRYTNFLVARIARIYPVHFVMLLAWVVLVGLTTLRGIPIHEAGHFTKGSLIASLLLVQGWTLPVHLSWNGPAWSLSNEWFAYLTFPLSLFLVSKLRRTPLLVVVALTLPCLLTWGLLRYPLSAPHTQYGLYRIGCAFLMGVILEELYRRRPAFLDFTSRFGIIWMLLALLLSLALEARHVPFYMCEIFLALYLYSLACGEGFGVKLHGSRPFIWAGKISFAVYMSQSLYFAVADRVLLPRVSAHAEVGGLLYLAGALSVPLLMSVGLYYLVEEPARRVISRAWTRKEIGQDAYVRIS